MVDVVVTGAAPDRSPRAVTRRVYPQVLAKLLGVTRSLADAEDAVHDAIERALKTWMDRGPPQSAEAWLITVAQNAHRDRLRRSRRTESHGDAVRVLAELSPWARIAVAEPEVLRAGRTSSSGCCSPAAIPRSKRVRAPRSRSRRWWGCRPTRSRRRSSWHPEAWSSASRGPPAAA